MDQVGPVQLARETTHAVVLMDGQLDGVLASGGAVCSQVVVSGQGAVIDDYERQEVERVLLQSKNNAASTHQGSRGTSP
jgi:hypothetical protein